MKRLFKKLDCFRALRVSNCLFYEGLSCVLVGCGIGYWDLSRILAGGLVMGGFAAMLGGWALGLRFVVCPHCGEPLYEFPRLPSDIPEHCPHCGEKLDRP